MDWVGSNITRAARFIRAHRKMADGGAGAKCTRNA